MIERIQTIINQEQTTPSAFADEIGISRGAMNHILNGRNKPSLDVLLKIVNRYKNINLEWLIQGVLPMYRTEKVAFQADLFDQNPKKQAKDQEETKYAKEMADKDDKIPTKQADIKGFIDEYPISDHIDKIVIFFKNKTFITLKPED